MDGGAVTVRFMLEFGSNGNNNVLAEMHDMREVPAIGDFVHIDKARYEVLERNWDLIPLSGYPESCSVTVHVRRWR